MEICEGCEAPMVASSSSCTCAVCGTTCTGRFAGCASVWARGPVPVAVTRRPLRTRGEPAVLVSSSPTDGSVLRGTSGDGGSADVERPVGASAPGISADVLRRVLEGLDANAAAVRALHEKVDELDARLGELAARAHGEGGAYGAVCQHGEEPGDGAFEGVLDALDALPRRISAALATVLRDERDPAVVELSRRIDVLIERSEEAVATPAAAVSRGGYSAAR